LSRKERIVLTSPSSSCHPSASSTTSKNWRQWCQHPSRHWHASQFCLPLWSDTPHGGLWGCRCWTPQAVVTSRNLLLHCIPEMIMCSYRLTEIFVSVACRIVKENIPVPWRRWESHWRCASWACHQVLRPLPCTQEKPIGSCWLNRPQILISCSSAFQAAWWHQICFDMANPDISHHVFLVSYRAE